MSIPSMSELSLLKALWKEHPLSAREIHEMALFHRPDDDPDLSWLSQTDEQMGEGFAEHGAARLASFGESWRMIGIRAEAEISVGGILQTITSGGLWAIESDSSPEYLRSVEDD